MSTKNQKLQALMRLYREKTGEEAMNMHEMAKFAVSMGMKLPPARTGLDRLAEQFSSAAREEMGRDEVTGRPYRANLAVTTWQSGTQMTFWYDINTAPKKIAHKSFTSRRDQMVGDAVQLTLDIDHWNRINDHEAPIEMPMDLTQDVQWRLNEPPAEDEKAA